MNDAVITNKNERKARAERLKRLVMALLSWTDMRYAEFQYEQGTRYLNAYLDADQYSIEVMENSRIFWNWWKNHWMLRDEEFMRLHHAHPIRRTEIARQLYAQYNKGTMLATSIHPNATVLNESYLHMTREMIEEAV